MDYEKLAGEMMSKFLRCSHHNMGKESIGLIRPGDFVLQSLKHQGGRAYPKGLSESFMVSTARMAVILKRLDESGYITRSADPADRRQTVVLLTPAGEEYLSVREKEITKRFARVLEQFGEKDAREYCRLQTKLLDIVKNGIDGAH